MVNNKYVLGRQVLELEDDTYFLARPGRSYIVCTYPYIPALLRKKRAGSVPFCQQRIIVYADRYDYVMNGSPLRQVGYGLLKRANQRVTIFWTVQSSSNMNTAND